MFAPRMSLRRPTDLDPITCEEFVDAASAEGRLLTSATCEELRLRDASLVECAVEDLFISDLDLTGLCISESSIDRLHAPQLSCSRSAWRDVSLSGSRIGAAVLYDTEWSGVHVTDSKIDLVNFRGAELSDVLLERCQIGELDLTGAAASRVQFRDCSLETLVLSAARLTDVDLRGAAFRRVTGLEHLRGATVSSEQLEALASHLADHLGIHVDDPRAHD